MNTTKALLLTLLILGCESTTGNQSQSDPEAEEAIRINQVGYYPDGPKKVIVSHTAEFDSFDIVHWSSKETVFQGTLSSQEHWELSGERVQTGDFSGLSRTGAYAVHIPGLGYSYPFEIGNQVLGEAFRASIKALYYQRASMELDRQNAGIWQRKMGHPDDQVLFHPSSGSDGEMSSPGGWYDAGDYGKYVVNGAFSLGQLLMLYEQYPRALDSLDLNIPESGNEISDYLDEIKYEMDWLLTMQDTDGGVFFKLTTKNFEGMVMPEDATSQRYIIGKSTTSTLDFAAAAAKCYTNFHKIDVAYAQRCLQAAQSAWDWAIQNPEVAFRNPPDVATGQYGDHNFDQEFYWAAAELYIATGDQQYLTYLTEHSPELRFGPGNSWNGFMLYLGVFTLIDHLKDNPLVSPLKESVISVAHEIVDRVQSTAYFQPFEDFQWGSNSDQMNAAVILAQAYRIDPKPEYFQAIQEITDYIFGKNATGYSFLTGYGDRTPQFIHHRPSSADGIAEPVPGLLSGGPNSSKQDRQHVTYPENDAPMQCWADQEPSYASNEICLNWNAPLTYVLGFLELEGAQ